MTFRDLKLPKDLSKKKKLELYKCWILSPLDKGSEQRVLELNWESDRYGLSEHAAVAYAINQLGSEVLLSHTNNLVEYLSGKCFVIMRLVLLAGTMEEEILIPPNNSKYMDLDPHYDPDMGVLNVTIRYRTADMEIKNYALTNINIEIDGNTHIANITDIELQEQVINHSVSGGN